MYVHVQFKEATLIALLTPSSQLVRRPYLCRVGRKLVDIEPGAFAANETD